MKKFLSLVLLTFVTPVFGKEHLIEDQRCVSSSLQRIHTNLIDYPNYHRLDNNNKTKVFGLVDVNMVDMFKSQTRWNQEYRFDSPDTDAYVWIVLQPFSLGAGTGSYYPKFLIRCQSTWSEDRSSIEHSCKMETKTKHYAVSNFRSQLSISKDQSQCSSSEYLLDYTLRLETNGNEILEIKQAIRDNFFHQYPSMRLFVSDTRLDQFIDEIFDEDKFFVDYYTKFYNAWAQKI